MLLWWLARKARSTVPFCPYRAAGALQGWHELLYVDRSQAWTRSEHVALLSRFQPVWYVRFYLLCKNKYLFISVSLISIANQTYALVLHGNGFCFNSETHNKQPAPALCDITQTNTPYVLVYSFGPLGLLCDLSHFFETYFKHDGSYEGHFHKVDTQLLSAAWVSAGASNAYITSCSDVLLHGMYDMGSSPSAGLVLQVLMIHRSPQIMSYLINWFIFLIRTTRCMRSPHTLVCPPTPRMWAAAVSQSRETALCTTPLVWITSTEFAVPSVSFARAHWQQNHT